MTDPTANSENRIEQALLPLCEFQCASFVAVYKVGEQGLELPPYKGSALRGGFGHVFKQVACTCPRNEKGHVEKYFAQCVYAYVFETSSTKESEVLKNNDDVPRPFVLQPPDDRRTQYAPGERLMLGFTLFGRGIDYLPYFIYVLDAMGRQGLGRSKRPVELRQVFPVDINGDWMSPIYEAGSRRLDDDAAYVISGRDLLNRNMDGSGVKVHFLTPTRLKYQGGLTDQPEFHVILRAAVRRVTSILFFHHDGIKLDIDFPSLFQAAERVERSESDLKWTDWERYSNRQKQKMKMGGIVGNAVYQGDLPPFLPWLSLSECTHIGKNPVFGLGRVTYQVES